MNVLLLPRHMSFLLSSEEKKKKWVDEQEYFVSRNAYFHALENKSENRNRTKLLAFICFTFS
jgi:hypothetical protein